MLQALLKDRFQLVIGISQPSTKARQSLCAGLLQDDWRFPAGRPVVDKTGLTERYSYALSYSLPRTDGNLPDNATPDLFSAVQEQL